ncbi:MAG: MarR family transcriptional regulator [Elainellaceae cyanobacterium]
MANVVSQLRDWLLEKRPFRMERLQKDAAYQSEVEDSLGALPDNLAQQLTHLVAELPSHPADKAAICEALSEAIARWKDAPSATNNSLTIIGSPVSAVARILTEGLTDWTDHNDLSLTLLDWVERPVAPEEIRSRLEEVLGQGNPEAEPKVAIIPNLSWCFLRTAEGLDGIDYLRDNLLSDASQFWVIGSGQVGFHYLNCVLKLQAHCGEIMQLPCLSGEQLRDWLMPIIKALNIRLDEDPIQERLQHLGEEHLESSSFSTLTALYEEITTSLKSLFRDVRDDALSSKAEDKGDMGFEWKDYFDRLADLAGGVSTVALQLFVKSIYYEKIEGETKQALIEEFEDKDKTLKDYVDFKPPPMHRVVAKLPKLPSLPNLDQSDLYILYSLLVHGDLTLTALAESLGEERQVVNDAVQMMRGTGIVEQQEDIVKVNPMHYPRLKRRLTSNNFIIDSPD